MTIGCPVISNGWCNALRWYCASFKWLIASRPAIINFIQHFWIFIIEPIKKTFNFFNQMSFSTSVQNSITGETTFSIENNFHGNTGYQHYYNFLILNVCGKAIPTHTYIHMYISVQNNIHTLQLTHTYMSMFVYNVI